MSTSFCLEFSFCSFLALFTVFCVFSQPIFKFCRVVQSNLYSAKTAANDVLKFIVLRCPFFFSLFFSFIFTLLFPALSNDLCVKTTLNLVTLVFQETGDKTKKQRALWCYNARAVTNHIADFAPLIYI